MGFECRVIEQEGHRLHELIDRESGYRIQVDNLGAELVSIAHRADDGTWVRYLYRDGDVKPAKQGWQSHATVMGYFLHRIKGEKTSYEGDEIRGGNHGLLRHKRLADPEVILAEQGTLSYSLPTNQISVGDCD
jgi:galactose mutarotase-like enzyme